MAEHTIYVVQSTHNTTTHTTRKTSQTTQSRYIYSCIYIYINIYIYIYIYIYLCEHTTYFQPRAHTHTFAQPTSLHTTLVFTYTDTSPSTISSPSLHAR